MKKIFLITILFVFSSLLFAQDFKITPFSEEYLNFINTKGIRNNYGYIPLPFETTNIYNDEDIKTNIPSKYDLRDSGYLLPVRSQSPYGTCWAFGSIASLESNALVNNNDIDYISVLNVVNKNPYEFVNLDDGGNIFYTMAYLSNLKGPVAEKDDPYVDPYKSPSKQLARIGVCNNAEVYDDDNYGLSTQEIKIIKERIYTKGAVCAAYYHGYSYLNENSYYCPYRTTPNHMIAFVGWDDNYSKNKFADTPQGKGAFLVRNSWGSSWGDDGYFWISYYDKNIIQVAGFEFKNNKQCAANKLYSYSKTSMTNALGCRYGLVKFTAAESGIISGVQTYCYSGGITFKAVIKINNQTKGSVSKKINYWGYTNIDLTSPISYNKGDKIFLYLDYDNKDTGYEYLPIEGCYASYSPSCKAGTNYFSQDGTNYVDIKSTFGDYNIAAGILVKIVVLPTYIKLSDSALSMTVGSSKTLTATVLPSNATNKKVTWSTTNKKVATVNASGKITAVGAGSCVIKCTSNAKSSVYKTCKVTVTKPVYVTKVSLSKTSLSILKGQSATLTATVLPSSATVKTVKWTSTNTKVATVSTKGVVKAIKAGTCYIKVTTDGTDKNGKKLTASCKVTVTEPVYVTNLTLSKTNLTLKKGKTYTLKATVSPSNATVKTVKWSSTNTKIATVSTKGVVKAIKAGTCYIKVITDGKNKSGKQITKTCKVVVK